MKHYAILIISTQRLLAESDGTYKTRLFNTWDEAVMIADSIYADPQYYTIISIVL